MNSKKFQINFQTNFTGYITKQKTENEMSNWNERRKALKAYSIKIRWHGDVIHDIMV